MMRALWLSAFLISLLYLCGLSSDPIGGLFGIMADDEGAYLLSAKNAVLFGQAHFFEADRWHPELIAPLLHRLGLLTISSDAPDPLYYVRFCIALTVLAGSALLSLIAAKHHGNKTSGLVCFLFISLNPVLFFYARAGLTEGLQYGFLSLTIVALFILTRAVNPTHAAIISILAGIFIAAIAVGKISALPACIGLVAGCVCAITNNRALARKSLVIACLVVGLLVTYALYMHAIDPAEWWRANITDQAMNRAPLDLGSAIAVFIVKFPDIAYYLSLMPIFALYLFALPAAISERSFLGVLAITTLFVTFLESFFGGEIRRNFFGLALLSITFGMSGMSYLKNGIHIRGRFAWLVSVLVALYFWGIAYLLYGSIKLHEPRFILACASFLVLSALIALSTTYRRLRAPIIAFIAACSLTPMIYQAFFAPTTRLAAARAMDALVAHDGVIIGHSAPYYFPALKRRVVMTNCTTNRWIALYANPIDALPDLGHSYYLGSPDPAYDPCRPSGPAPAALGTFGIIDPIHFGGPASPEDRIILTARFSLYGNE